MNKLTILVAKHGRPSQKELFKRTNNSELIIRSAIFDGFVKRNNPNNLAKREKQKNLNLQVNNGVLIRWGCTSNVATQGSIVYNKAEAINLANDKLGSRKALEAADVPVPKTYSYQDLQNADNIKWPLIGRPKQHGRGKNFNMCDNMNMVNASRNNKSCVYWSEVYPKTREFRVHCQSGKIASILSKPAPTNPQSHAWNFYQQNIPFENIPQSQWTNYICKTALAAVEALGLDFGGVDILVCDNYQELGIPRVTVCEVNTAPTLKSSEYTLGKYTQYFKWLQRSNEKRAHWPWREYEKPSSHAWQDSHYNS